MKKVNAIHLHSGNACIGYVLKTVADVDSAIKNNLAHAISREGIMNIINSKEPVFLNLNKGYCDVKGNYKISK